MTQGTPDHETLKQYLLGQLANEEQLAAIEERLLLDDDSFEELQLVKDDLIDQYLSEELTSSERKAFESNFLTTKGRHADVRQAQALLRYAKKNVPHVSESSAEKKTSHESKRRGSRFSLSWLLPNPSWGWAMALVLIVGIGLVTWRVFFYRTDVDRGLLALQTAYRLQRPVEARLSDMDYAPLPNTRGNDESRVDVIARQRAERLLLDAVQDDPGPASYRALGLLYVAQHKFDEAIQQFKKALESDPNDAQLHSDLGAALLEKAKLDRLNGEDGKSFEQLSESLEHLNRALALNPSALEALFNRALCRQYMHLPQLAAEDWRLYLQKDSQSAWATEARENLKLIESQPPKSSKNEQEILDNFFAAFRDKNDEAAWQLLSSNRDVSGGFLQNALLDRYLTQDAGGRVNEAQETLEAVSYAGELGVARAKDRFVSDLIRFYKTRTPSQRVLLAQARQVASEGHKNLKTSKPEDAAALYSKAKSTFDQLGDDSESLYVKYAMGHAYLLDHKSQTSLTIFQEVARDAEAKGYRWLFGQSLSGLGNVQTGLDDYSAALNNSFRASEISGETGDIVGRMKAADQLSNIYRRLGNYSKAVDVQERGLSQLDEHRVDALQMWRSYRLMALSLHLLGWDAAAESFQRESLKVAKELGPDYVCRSHVDLGVIYGSQRNYEEATKNVRAALELAQGISSKATRDDTAAYSSLQLGHLYRQAGEFNRAITSYDEVLKTYEGADYPAFRYAAHKGKLLACLAQGGCAGVQQEIVATLDLFENYRSKILEQENKFVFFDAEQDVYDAVIEYESEINRNSTAAFDYSERSRARSLLGQTTESVADRANSHHPKPREAVSSHPLSSMEIAQRMPAEVQLLQYSVLPDKVLIWLVSPAGIQSFEHKIDAGDLRNKVSAYLQLLSSPPVDNEEAVRNASAEFYDLLIKPAEAALDGKKQLCIVPDKALNYLPYAAFLSRASGKYLTQEYALTRAPSTTLFIVSSESANTRSNVTGEKLLSVGNPRFDHKAFPGLADLPASKRESEAIAGMYNSGPPLTGEGAVKSRVVAEMEKANVIHLALHAVVNEHSPLRSRLLLADSTLEINEIYQMQLPKARLVVLSACESGAGRYYDGEGVIGISRPFIAKGVPLVVGSLWSVDSNATAELMISFHQKRTRDNVSTAEALTLAQREMLVHPDPRYRHPYYWAPFVVIGGYARF